MKAAQRFMRPVKEIREGFFTMEDDLSSTDGSSSHVMSATRHFEEQYSSRAAEAGLPSSRLQSSRLSTPRGSIQGLNSRTSLPNKQFGTSQVSPQRMGIGTEGFVPGAPGMHVEQSADLMGTASLLQHQPV